MIQFANPAALWLLSLFVPLILLYLLKHRKRDHIVPSLLLWKQAIEDFRAQTPFQKLRSNLLLLLQILVLVLLTALLSKPFIAHASQEGTRWILVLDISASMKATDESPNRFAVARSRLLKTLATTSPVDEIMLISLSSESSILQSFSRNHAAIRSNLLSLEPQDIGQDWNRLAKILQPLVRQKPRPRIVIASDFADFPAPLTKELSFEALPVGTSDENVAITRVALQPVVQNLKQQILFFEVRNFGKETRAADLEIRRDKDLIDAYEITVGPSQSIQKSIPIEIEHPTQLSLFLKSPDFLALDNDFIIESYPREKIRISLRSKNPFLVKALEAIPSVEIAEKGQLRIGDAQSEMQEPGIYFQRGSKRSQSEIVQWDAAHPVLRFVDAELWRFSSVSILTIPEDADVLLETRDGPVGYATQKQSARQILLGFSLEDSNLPWMAGFPVFLQNAAEWISEPLQNTMPLSTHADHKKEGPYQSGKLRAYANFLDAQESNIQPQREFTNSASDVHLVSMRKDLSMWFLLSLISVVILEWWAFHQKYEV